MLLLSLRQIFGNVMLRIKRKMKDKIKMFFVVFLKFNHVLNISNTVDFLFKYDSTLHHTITCTKEKKKIIASVPFNSKIFSTM